MWNTFAPRLRQAIFKAVELAAARGAPEADSHDLLASILRDRDSAGAIIHSRCGIDARWGADLVAGLQRSGRAAYPQDQVILSRCAMHLLHRAKSQASQLGDDQVGTEHVMLAVYAGTHWHELARNHLREWRDEGMPRPSMPTQLPSARTVEGRVRRALRLPRLAYGVYVQHSLAHPKFVTDPYPLYAKLRSRERVRRDPLLPVWIATGYNEVVTTLRDPRFRKELFLSDSLSDVLRRQFKLPEQRDAGIEGEPMAMLFLDPPRHTKYRGMFNRAFTPQALQRLRPRVQQITDEILDRAARRGKMDVIADLAYPLPTLVIAELLGFPSEDYAQLKKWSDDFAAALTISPTVEQQKRSNQSREEMREYFNALVERMKRERFGSDDSLMRTLMSAGCGEDDGPLTRQEFFANCALLIAAGHETTTNLIGNGVLALLRHPDQLDLLRREPTLIKSAVEELLRFDSPVQWTARVASEDLELGGKRITRGEFVLSSLGAANRDPKQFDDPDRLDIRRADNRHVAFGQGIHFCIGAALARMEAEIAIGSLVSRFGEIRLRTRPLQWNPGFIFRGVKALRVELR